MWYGMVQDQITKQLRAKGEPVPDLNAVAVPIRSTQSSSCSRTTSCCRSSPACRPTASARSARRAACSRSGRSPMFAEGEEPETPMEPTLLPYDSQDFPQIPQQDYSNIPLQQNGLHADGFEFMRLSQGHRRPDQQLSADDRRLSVRRCARQAGQGHATARRQFRRKDSGSGIVTLEYPLLQSARPGESIIVKVPETEPECHGDAGIRGVRQRTSDCSSIVHLRELLMPRRHVPRRARSRPTRRSKGSLISPHVPRVPRGNLVPVQFRSRMTVEMPCRATHGCYRW